MSVADPYANLIPEARYRAVYLRYEKGKPYGQERWFAWFQITEHGEFFGLNLVRFYNVPRRPYLARTHNLFHDYVAATGSRPPAKGLTPDFLKGCEVLVEVTHVRNRIVGRRRIEQPEDCWYSKIDGIVRLTAGSPAMPRCAR